MKSTSNSKAVILRLTDMKLVFHAETYRSRTLRDLFFRMTHPLPKKQPKKIITVADGINLEIRQGERVGIIGTNGSGKTSLCRCIAGTYKPSAGSVEVFGKVRAIFDIGLGIQPELTGRENADLLSAFMFPEDENRHELVQKALEFSELGEFLDVPYRTYSNGMQARLCLSLAAAKACDLYILDEVFDGADRFFREKISARMIEVLRQSGAVIFVSHNPEQILTVCNRIIVLRNGKIEYDGPVQAGLDYYAKLGASARSA
jgi:ABC-type polysaccharide/polyol phosphate transport system ATPase subunit